MKRVLILILALMVLELVQVAGAEVFIVDCGGDGESQGYALLLRDDGQVLTAEQAYGDIGLLTPEDTPQAQRLYRVEPVDLSPYVDEVDEDDYSTFTRLAVMGPGGELLTGYDYCELRWDEAGYVIGRRWAGGVEALDPQGNVVFSGDYLDIHPNGWGGWLVLRGDRAPTEEDMGRATALFIDAEGEVHDTGLHTFYNEYLSEGYSGGWCPLSEVEEYDGLSVLVDAGGSVAFGRAFDGIEAVYEGRAVIMRGDKYGLLDHTGAYAIKPTCDSIILEDRFSRVLYAAERGETIEVYDAQTMTMLFERTFEGADYVYEWQYAEGLMMLGCQYAQELTDLSGRTCFTVARDKNISESYVECDGIPERFVENLGEWPEGSAHLIDADYNVIGDDWQSLTAELWRDGQGRYVTTTYATYTDGAGGAYPVWYSYRCGVIDESGQVIIPAIYQNLRTLSLDRYWVETADRVGMIDAGGKWYYVFERYTGLMD